MATKVLDGTQITDQDIPESMKPVALVPKNEFELLAFAVQHNSAIDTIERLSALQEKAWQRNAELAFNEAMNAAQSEITRVVPTLENNQTRSKYASYATLDKAIRPVYIKHGFSLSFDTDPSVSPEVEMVRVRCIVSHREGHTRTYHYDMPADGKGAKGGDVMTKTHARAAAGSYGMRYLLKMIFNVAIGEDDNDGNEGLGEEFIDGWTFKMEESDDLESLKSIFKECFTKARAAKDTRAVTQLTKAYEARKRVLRG